MKGQESTGFNQDLLCVAVDEMIEGMIDADLGGGILKKRVQMPGCGKR